jgi:hypothetical protein
VEKNSLAHATVTKYRIASLLSGGGAYPNGSIRLSQAGCA